jgi:hypothetical protein
MTIKWLLNILVHQWRKSGKSGKRGKTKEKTLEKKAENLKISKKNFHYAII